MTSHTRKYDLRSSLWHIHFVRRSGILASVYKRRGDSASKCKGKGKNMSFNLSNIRWGRVILWIILGALIAFLIPNIVATVYLVVLGFQMRGTPPQEVQIAVLTGAFYNLVAILGTALGAFIGGRQAARGVEEDGYQLNGLVTGIGVAILATVTAVLRISAFTLWAPLHLILAVAGGWFGGWLVARRASSEEL